MFLQKNGSTKIFGKILNYKKCMISKCTVLNFHSEFVRERDDFELLKVIIY